MPICSISIDVDPLRCYYEIHGLGEVPADLRNIVATRCLPRFSEILDRRGIPATFFVVAEDLDQDGKSGEECTRQFAAIAAKGHELANHTYSHPYDLGRCSRGRVAEELVRAHTQIEAATGVSPRGFRAPGYAISRDILEELMRLGYLYDSSVFPSPGYYAAKLAMMSAMRILGRSSGAVTTDPRSLLAPIVPYRPSAQAPWKRGQASVVQLPIGVTPVTRIPLIGTSLLLAPSRLRAGWLDSVRHQSFLNLEFHALDLVDATEDRIPNCLVRKQPDLRIPGREKLRILEATLDRLAADYQFATLASAARIAQREWA